MGSPRDFDACLESLTYISLAKGVDLDTKKAAGKLADFVSEAQEEKPETPLSERPLAKRTLYFSKKAVNGLGAAGWYRLEQRLDPFAPEGKGIIGAWTSESPLSELMDKLKGQLVVWHLCSHKRKKAGKMDLLAIKTNLRRNSWLIGWFTLEEHQEFKF